ncbi:hypothetical protein AALA69_03415 [Eggerthellaceae bacterium 24-137]
MTTTLPRLRGLAAARLLAVAAAGLLAFSLLLLATPSPAHAATADKPTIQWIQKSSHFYCKVDGVKQKDGLKKIGNESYLFDKKGRQLTGWHKVGKSYRYFTAANKAKGSMVAGKVVNGVKLDKQGRAVLNSQSRAELKVLVKATEFVKSHTRPAWSQKKKLRTCYNLLKNKYSERAYRGFSSKTGWQRAFALDIFDRKSGSCHSYAAAFAYIASAIGCKSCKVVSSGGHSWAEVNGKVYDPEWAKHCRTDLFAYPYSKSGRGGTPRYQSARKYVVTIAPRTTAFGGKSSSTRSATTGAQRIMKVDGKLHCFRDGKTVTKQWVTSGGATYYFQKDGTAATGPVKIGGTRYVFSAKGKLLVGTKTRVVSVSGVKYRVTKAGKAKSGWDSGKQHYYAANGRMATGTTVINEKLTAFTAKGRYNAEKTKQLRAVARIDADAAPLLKLLGTPQKRTYSASCYQMTDADGNALLGDDGRLVYPTFTVFTFKAENGIEYYRGAEAR